ncbi:MAG: transcriptional regulator, AraC family [Sediminibacterium sp.]|nr:transcriptional regulator, AraC family [Sediminibacterium sp.]
MQVKNLKPNNRITEYVDRVLVIESYQNDTPILLTLFANGSPTLVFNYATGTIKNHCTTHLTLFGQTIFPETLIIGEDFTLIAYFFKPYALGSIFGLIARELTDRPVDLNLLAPQKTGTLQEQLLNAGTTNNRIAFLDNYITGLIAAAKTESPVIKYAANKITCNTSVKVLAAVQKEMHMTERTFQRMFEKNLGIAPNLYRRICQFNAAFQQLNNRRYHTLSDIAYENGYADQSHYIRSFKEFTNLTPKDYLNFMG